MVKMLMKLGSDDVIERRLLKFSRSAAITVLVAAVLVLVGWVFDIATLKGILPNWTTMKPNTALGLLLSGLALALLLQARSAGLAWYRGAGRSAAGFVILLGLLTLLEYLGGWDFGIDQWLFRDTGISVGVTHAGRMSPITALSFLVLGMTLLLLDVETRRVSNLAQWLAVLTGLAGFLALLGYLYDVQALQRVGPHSSMALHTALSFLMLSAAVLCARPSLGVMGLLTSKKVGGVMARRLVPAAILVPPLLGGLRTLGERAGWYGPAFGRALLVCAVVVVFTYLICRNAVLLNLIDVRRKRAEKALRKSQEQLLSLVEQAPISIAMFDCQMRYIVTSHRWKEDYGKEIHDLTGRSHYELHPDLPQQWKDIHRRGLAGEFLKSDEDEWIDASGRQRWLRWAVHPWRDAQGAIGGLIISAEDISERKYAEQALRLSEERTRLIVENALDAVITMDNAGLISGWSAQAESIFGWRPQEVIGRVLAETIIPPQYREAHRQGLQRFLTTGKARVLDTRIEIFALHRDGHEFPVELAITPIRSGNEMAFSAFVRDITERNKAAQALRESEARFRTLAESLPQLVWTCRPDGWCDYLSRQWLEYTGRTHEEQVGYGWAEQLHPQDRARAQLEWGEAAARGEHFDIEFRIRRHDGPYRWFKTRAVPLRNAAGDIVKWFGSNTDVEDLKRSEAFLQQAYEDLRQSQQVAMQQDRFRVIGQMASGVAHDINNALSPAALYVESLLEREPNLSARARDYLQTTQRAIGDVSETIGRMREFYRQRDEQLTLAPVQLNTLVQQAADLTRARWHDMPQQRGVVIQLQIGLAAGLPDIMGVESEIRDALTNLIFNAVDAMPAGGLLALRTSASQQVHVEVADTGIGMDEATRARVMEPFFTTKGERGTGLGLAMVYGMVQRHSAGIEIESTPGKGSTVRLSFPIAEIPAAESTSAAAVAEVPTGLHILLIDDDPLLLKSLLQTLELDGHTAVAATGGQEGIDVFRASLDGKETFAVVITDLGMPYVDGRKVAAAVKTASPSTPVIMLTGWGRRLMSEGDIPPHVDRVLCKPPKLRELRGALSTVSIGRAG